MNNKKTEDKVFEILFGVTLFLFILFMAWTVSLANDKILELCNLLHPDKLTFELQQTCQNYHDYIH